jgi:hypothetical protein
MEIVQNKDGQQEHQQKIPAGIYFLVSKSPDIGQAIGNLQNGLNSDQYRDAKLLHTFASSEAMEVPLQPGKIAMVHILIAVIRVGDTDSKLEDHIDNFLQ